VRLKNTKLLKNITVKFYDQDGDNFLRNLITGVISFRAYSEQYKYFRRLATEMLEDTEAFEAYMWRWAEIVEKQIYHKPFTVVRRMKRAGLCRIKIIGL